MSGRIVAEPDSTDARLLLLAPSSGLGGGIERVMDAVTEAWDGPVARINLLDSHEASDGPRAPRPLEAFRFTVSAAIVALRFRPTIVLCGHLGILPVAAAVTVAARAPVSLMAYGVDVWRHMPLWERSLIARCSQVLAISSYTAEHFCARAQLDPARVQIVPLPIEPSLLARASKIRERSFPSPTERKPYPRGSTFITVSRIVPTNRFKGHFLVATSFERVLETHPDARWIVVGAGDDLPTLKAKCHRLRIDTAVTFAGKVPDAQLADLYEMADVFVLPSIANARADPAIGEGFGLVFAEAGAFGLPSIGSSQGGGSTDFVQHGITGLTVPPNDAAALTAAMVRLIEDEDSRVEWGANARQLAFSRHQLTQFSASLRVLLVR